MGVCFLLFVVNKAKFCFQHELNIVSNSFKKKAVLYYKRMVHKTIPWWGSTLEQSDDKINEHKHISWEGKCICVYNFIWAKHSADPLITDNYCRPTCVVFCHAPACSLLCLNQANQPSPVASLSLPAFIPRLRLNSPATSFFAIADFPALLPSSLLISFSCSSECDRARLPVPCPSPVSLVPSPPYISATFWRLENSCLQFWSVPIMQHKSSCQSWT